MNYQRNHLLKPQELNIVSSKLYTNTHDDPGESRGPGQNSYSSSELFMKNKGSIEPDKRNINS